MLVLKGVNPVDWLLLADLQSKQNTKLYEQIQLVDYNYLFQKQCFTQTVASLGGKKS